ncbi:MAG: four helix bundle suffix domain-containing protein [Phycisphaerales bacterium]
MSEREPLIPPHGGYRKLKSFQVSQSIYDVTVRFCDLYIDKRSRTHDQMVQAARSGTQNIVEGSEASGTSKKTELKLTGVAKASQEELRLDYQDYLRQRGLEEWPPNHPALLRFKARRCATLGEIQVWVKEERKLALATGKSVKVRGRPCRSVQTEGNPPASVPSSPQLVANAALSLLNLSRNLLKNQLAAQAAAFEAEGGFTERLYRLRTQNRRPQGREK